MILRIDWKSFMIRKRQWRSAENSENSWRMHRFYSRCWNFRNEKRFFRFFSIYSCRAVFRLVFWENIRNSNSFWKVFASRSKCDSMIDSCSIWTCSALFYLLNSLIERQINDVEDTSNFSCDDFSKQS
jgi:hypothetical protein